MKSAQLLDLETTFKEYQAEEDKALRNSKISPKKKKHAVKSERYFLDISDKLDCECEEMQRKTKIWEFILSREKRRAKQLNVELEFNKSRYAELSRDDER